MTRVFVFTNHKGGVGKSTSATNTALGIAGMLRRAGAPNARVLLIDTDSQAHATLVTTGTKDYSVDNSLYTVLMADRQNAAQTLLNCIVQSTWDADLHILSASPMLEGAERELMGIAGAPYRLADPLSRIANRYAAIVIDTRPSFSLMTEMGLIAATDAIVPVEPRYLETVGLMSVIGKINDIREGWRQPNLRVSGILVTKMNTRIRGHNHLLDELKGHSVLGKLLLGVVPANEEQLLHDLVNLAITIRDDGQVNPLTVVDVSQGVTQQFRIETGERRYWATWLLRDFITGYSSDGMIPCIIIPIERSSVFRQAKENTARSGLSAIAMARQAALPVLTVHGYEIPSHAVANDFYRQALELDLRGKREYTEAVLSAMSGIKKVHFSGIKALLRLSDEAMELAD